MLAKWELGLVKLYLVMGRIGGSWKPGSFRAGPKDLRITFGLAGLPISYRPSLILSKHWTKSASLSWRPRQLYTVHNNYQETGFSIHFQFAAVIIIQHITDKLVHTELSTKIHGQANTPYSNAVTCLI